MARSEFEERLASLVRRRVPGCEALIAAERLSGGANQETYRITVRGGDGPRRLCLRRAAGGVGRHEHGQPGLATEARLMQVARDAGVPEPEVLHVLGPDDGLGEGFLMEWLDGETLGAKIVRAPEFAAVRPRLARECGEVLARIHAIDVDATGLRDRLETLSPEQFVRRMWLQYQGYATPQPMIDYTARWLLAHLPEPSCPALVHNDFRNGNLMIDAGGIRAVLDWEIAHLGDPMRDLGWICTNSWRFGVSDKPVGGFGGYADLCAGYEAVSGRAVNREHLKFWEVFGSFWWAIECLGMADHYRHGPDQTVERPGIARRSSECQIDCVNLLMPGPVEMLAAPGFDDDEMPRLDELLSSVRDFLHQDVMAETTGRTSFLARVAGNSLDIVLRDLALGSRHRDAELRRMRALLGTDGTLPELRWKLALALRAGSIALDTPALQAHLRTTVANQLAIDQPKYSGLRTALAGGGRRPD
ncbi:MAG: phosphotransferase family protein [Gammaproteobacteria bacterium]|nr:phosphotransferase family protein [Gammaproteobacteria bacterium]